MCWTAFPAGKCSSLFITRHTWRCCCAAQCRSFTVNYLKETTTNPFSLPFSSHSLSQDSPFRLTLTLGSPFSFPLANQLNIATEQKRRNKKECILLFAFVSLNKGTHHRIVKVGKGHNWQFLKQLIQGQECVFSFLFSSSGLRDI